ncbi:MAG: hypothetical protein Q9198_002833 [Flavoplaca austrocitrina]
MSPPSLSPKHDIADPPQALALASDALGSRPQVEPNSRLDGTPVGHINGHSLDGTEVSDFSNHAKVQSTRGRRPSVSAEAVQLQDRDPTPTPNIPASHRPGPQAEASNTLRSSQTPAYRRLGQTDDVRPQRGNLKYSGGTESASISLRSSVQPRTPERGFHPGHLTSGPPLPETKSSYGPQMSSEVEPASSGMTIGQLIRKFVADEVLSREQEALIHFSPWERLPPGVLVPKLELWEDACRKRISPQVQAPIQVFGTKQSFHHDYIKVVGNFSLWKYLGRQSNGLPEGYDKHLARFPTPAYDTSGGAETPKSIDTAY